MEAFSVTNLPSEDFFERARFNYDASVNTLRVTLPVLFHWTGSLAKPDEGPNGKDDLKWSVGCAIPTAQSDLIGQIRTHEAMLAKAHGLKGAFPSFLRDGAAKDASGLFLKSKGRLQDFHHFTAKTKRPPRIVEKAPSGMLEVQPERLFSGTFGLIAMDLIIIGFGSDTKKGTSAWFSSILSCGGGKPLRGGAQDDESDFGGLIPATPANAGAAEDFL